MRVHPQEVLMVGAIAWVLTLVAQIPQVGFWSALWMGFPLALLAGGAYWLLMPWVIRWAAKGLEKNPPPEEGEKPSDEADAKR
ncbi:hypothetical protein DV704_00375 [Meiothermus sp. QL-1]|uniref:hypothetical protein n=1 Tax=Meiothermus sp. QL-1 TaxID=2058095 RepID=UPI000E09F6EB|nr:hypothetical protein [Meiothermus sp. QL-1]RDI96318.1 hypothetical protein DV704_00375 [Meiothermus sp. QL-1]